MRAYFISRHQGAKIWARRQGLDVIMVEHLDPADVMVGDLIYGSLPVSLVADVCEKGARYFHLNIELSKEDRSKELSADDMDLRGAKLEEIRAVRL